MTSGFFLSGTNEKCNFSPFGCSTKQYSMGLSYLLEENLISEASYGLCLAFLIFASSWHVPKILCMIYIHTHNNESLSQIFRLR